MCVCMTVAVAVGVGKGGRRWSQVSTRRVNPQPAALPRGNLRVYCSQASNMRGKVPLLWGTMRSTFGSLSPSSHTLSRNLYRAAAGVGQAQGPWSINFWGGGVAMSPSPEGISFPSA